MHASPPLLQTTVPALAKLMFLQESTNVWVDHCEFYSQLVSDKDYYDGLVDASHAADYLTLS
jgi:pectate lyase